MSSHNGDICFEVKIMKRIIEDFFRKLVEHQDDLGAYIDSLYTNVDFDNDELNQLFGKLRDEGLIHCKYADNRAYFVSITYDGKHYFDESDPVENTAPAILTIMSEMDFIENRFRRNESLVPLDIIYDDEEFCRWKGELLNELCQLKCLEDKQIATLAGETYKAILSLQFNGYTDKNDFANLKGSIRAFISTYERYKQAKDVERGMNMKRKVFVVHGHDNESKEIVARTIEKLGLEAIILHEQADKGMTIIEKLISNAEEVDFAVVLYTECDMGREKNDDRSKERPRARQNVVFEHGLLIGLIGREKVMALKRGNVEEPGDISGVVYTDMDTSEWKQELVKNMKAVGLDVSLDSLIV